MGLVYIYPERKKTITFMPILYSVLQEGNPVTKNSTALMTLKGNVHAITDFMVFTLFLREVNKDIKEIVF